MGWPLGKKHSDETKKLMSEKSLGRKRILTEEHKLAISKARTGFIVSTETKQKISKSLISNTNSKGKVRSEEFKQKQRNSHLGKSRSEEFKRKMSIIMKGHKVSDKTLLAMKAKKSPEHCKKISESCISRNESNPKFNTYPEKCIKILLDQLKIEYYFQKGLCGFLVDFYIPSLKLIIEVDGIYWHGHPDSFNPNDKRVIKNMERDKRENKILKERGYKLIRIWEHEIPNTPEELAKLW
jgi:DNA mismatch endonuclease (patch repair protein)